MGTCGGPKTLSRTADINPDCMLKHTCFPWSENWKRKIFLVVITPSLLDQSIRRGLPHTRILGREWFRNLQPNQVLAGGPGVHHNVTRRENADHRPTSRTWIAERILGVLRPQGFLFYLPYSTTHQVILKIIHWELLFFRFAGLFFGRINPKVSPFGYFDPFKLFWSIGGVRP